MSTVHEIEQAVTHLSSEELANFREWFSEFDSELWDRQFEGDVRAGKLEALANEAIADFRSGRYKEL